MGVRRSYSERSRISAKEENPSSHRSHGFTVTNTTSQSVSPFVHVCTTLIFTSKVQEGTTNKPVYVKVDTPPRERIRPAASLPVQYVSLYLLSFMFTQR